MASHDRAGLVAHGSARRTFAADVMTGSRTSHALGLIGAIVRVIMIVLVHAGQGKAVRASETPTFVSVDVAPTPARKTNLDRAGSEPPYSASSR